MKLSIDNNLPTLPYIYWSIVFVNEANCNAEIRNTINTKLTPFFKSKP